MPVAQSSHLQFYDYRPDTGVLAVQFINGALYHYYNVPPDVYDTLSQSGSPGEYFHAKIRNQYEFKKLMDGATASGRRSRKGA